uniref:Thaumatin-like protein n=1 Tax=Pseudotsuga menziesii TaxID=3357 RepID=Q9ZRS9_PSEMZ|nr:Thaumatin-like protein [Pseudotsuga menziesii]
MGGRTVAAASIWIAATATLLALNAYMQGVEGVTMTVKNQCSYTVWAAGSPGGGKQLGQGETWSFDVAADTTGGRIWGRTGCSFDATGKGTCNTGDCGGLLSCQGYGTVPATLFEYGLNKYMNLDFLDISLVDGFNLPLTVTPSNSACKTISCTSDINAVCPSELKVTDGCKSACAEFNTPQYCCTGDYLNNCSPSDYSKFFKAQCPQAYSYAKDDATSTFTCATGSNYNVVFCG